MNRVFVIPLVANKMRKYEERHDGFEKEYFGELSLVMHEGMGVFNFGIGEAGFTKCGKS